MIDPKQVIGIENMKVVWGNDTSYSCEVMLRDRPGLRMKNMTVEEVHEAIFHEQEPTKHLLVERVLTLSTTHMPKTNPDFGVTRVAPHEYGFVVFVCSTPKEEETEWLAPALEEARRLGCSLINFDRDAATHPGLPTWDW